jgi:four helix bundle protein
MKRGAVGLAGGDIFEHAKILTGAGYWLLATGYWLLARFWRESSLRLECMRKIRRLRVWQLAMALATEIYDASTSFPADERFGMTRQIRRAALSVAANIAEGGGRETDREFRRFLTISLGSLEEVRTYLAFARLRRWSDRQTLTVILELCDQLGRQLMNLIKRLEASS